MLRACCTDGALGVTSREECTGVRSAALLNSVDGQYHGNKGRCNRANGDGRRRNTQERLGEGQDRRPSYRRPRAIPWKGGALQHRAGGDGWERNAEELRDEGQDRRSSHQRLRATLKEEEEL